MTGGALSGVDRAHVRIAIPGREAARRHLVDALQVRRREPDSRRAQVVLQVASPLRARNRDDVLALREHPGQRQLGGGAALLPGDLLYSLDGLEVPLEIL